MNIIRTSACGNLKTEVWSTDMREQPIGEAMVDDEIAEVLADPGSLVVLGALPP